MPGEKVSNIITPGPEGLPEDLRHFQGLDEMTYTNGAEHVYGLDEDGKRVHIPHDKLLESYGFNPDVNQDLDARDGSLKHRDGTSATEDEVSLDDARNEVNTTVDDEEEELPRRGVVLGHVPRQSPGQDWLDDPQRGGASLPGIPKKRGTPGGLPARFPREVDLHPDPGGRAVRARELVEAVDV